MFRSFSSAVQATFDTITTTAEALQKGIDIGNQYIDNQHKSMTRNMAKQAILDTAKQHRSIQEKLEADEKLATLFTDLEAEWDSDDPSPLPFIEAKPKIAKKK